MLKEIDEISLYAWKLFGKTMKYTERNEGVLFFSVSAGCFFNVIFHSFLVIFHLMEESSHCY